MALLDPTPVPPILLIVAPAGYGKSTLASQWIDTRTAPAAWLTLTTEHNSPGRFLEHLFGVLGGDFKEVHDGQPLLDDVLSRMKDVADEEPGTVLVLDDCHVIESSDVHHMVNVLATRIPDRMHLLLISRTLPPVPLARLRVNGKVREVVQDDLSFRRSELEQIASLLAPNPVSDAELDGIADRTAGWIAGIRMAMSTRERPSSMGRWDEANWIDNYFTEEVLGALPDDLHDFVLRSSVLPYLDVELCDDVLETTMSARMIDEVWERLVFVRPSGPNGRMLVYHALFAESVARIASRVMSRQQVLDLHLRAARWFFRRGQGAYAAEQAIRGELWDLAMESIRELCRPLVDRDHSHSTWYWLTKLPRELVLSDPELARWYISLLEHLGHHDAAADAYAQARPMWQESGEPEHLTYDLLSQTLGLAMSGDAERAVQKAYEAVAIAPDHLAVDLMHAWTYIYQIESFQGQDEKADRAFREAERHRAFLPSDQWYWLSNTEPHRINTEAVRGRLHSAEEMYTHTLENFPQAQCLQDGKLRYRRSAIWLEWNQGERVESELDDLRQQVRATLYRIWHQEALLHIAQARGALGDLHSMESTLREAREMFGERGGRHNLNRLEALEVELWLATGRLSLARDWARRKAHETYYAPPLLFGDPDPRLARVKTLVAVDEPAQALRLLAPMLEDATMRRRWAEAVSLRVWQMAGHLHLGDQAAALQSLALAVRDARPGGFVRSFMVEAPGLFPMLRKALVTLPEEDAAYVHALIGRGVWGVPTKVKGTGATGAWLPDPLSRREQEVLELLPSGLTNREIGERLFITERTVKRHVGNILAKLGANNRRTAVVRGWQLGLLEER